MATHKRRHNALVTGGGTGIGKATAARLVRGGYDVTIAGRRPEVLDGTRHEPQARDGHDLIGDLRGAGQYLGVEIVTDRDSKQPDGPSLTMTLNGLRQGRVLISVTESAGNVLKIRPLLVFEPRHAKQLLDVLADVLPASNRTARSRYEQYRTPPHRARGRHRPQPQPSRGAAR